MQSRLVLAGIAVLLIGPVFGCATAPKPGPINQAGAFVASYDEVWNAVVETFSELDLPPEKVEKSKGVLSTDWISFTGTGNEDYCDCGQLGPRVERAREGRLSAHVEESAAAGGVTVRVETLFRQVRVKGRSVATKTCPSTGALEAKVRSGVLARL